MGKSDMLSQRSDHGTGTRDNQDLTLLTPGLFAMRALEGLQVVGEEKDILKEIRPGMDIEDQEEVVVKAVKELKKSLAKSVRTSEWSMENSLLYYRGKIYVPGADLRHQILALFHDSKLRYFTVPHIVHQTLVDSSERSVDIRWTMTGQASPVIVH